jgi:lysophospholipase L1-like esterase
MLGHDGEASANTMVNARPGPLASVIVTRPRSLPALLVGAAAAMLVAAPTAAAEPPSPPAAAQLPTAVVVLGDSAASGEGAGDYEPGTRGENGDWCHRSVHAFVHRTGLAETSVNLACSGADSADVAFGPGTHHTEGSQAQRLGEVAATHRVTTVIVQVGANDDAALIDTGIACIRAFIDPREPPCRDTLDPLVPQRMAATAVKLEAAVGDVREAMRRAGYTDSGYTLLLASYASPVTEHMLPLQAALGCPYSKPDAAWGRTVLFPALSATIRGVAERTGARFLDLARATEGYEACTQPVAGADWHRRITVDPEALVYGGLDAVGYHLAQESFHPTAYAHAEMGRCVGEFVRSPDATAACVAGSDGHAHLEPAPAVPAPAA